MEHVKNICQLELANPLTKRILLVISIDLGCVLYFKEQEFKSKY